METISALLRRSERFMEDARWAYMDGHYDLACFYAEHAVELRLKARIAVRSSYTPWVHEVRELLSAVYSESKEFVEANRKALKSLEDSYNGARYGDDVYGEEEAGKCLRVMEDVFSML